ncbi:hypothetical protein XENOCAPTIV_009202 [Xenoophorus captivus]|uniref:Uncharacterized protein n=1 Tax=Xenoophorus captivus TaxID=1517983 RepID=A0ABV0RGH4_9TELE
MSRGYWYDVKLLNEDCSVSKAPTDLWESTGEEVASALRAMGLPIDPVVTMETKNKGGARDALNEIRQTNKAKGQL